VAGVIRTHFRRERALNSLPQHLDHAIRTVV
jgi:hypothetical protein